MYRTRRQFSPAVAAILALALAGCSTAPAEDPLDGEWAALQEEKAGIDGKRQELAELTVEAEIEPAEPAEGEEAVEPVDNSAQIEALASEISTLGDDFMTRLVTFLNDDPIIAEDGPTERQLAAVRLKSSEDMLVAREWIDEGGDYRRATQIYEAALQLDPDNAELKAALATAVNNRFMSSERFAAAKKGMTEAEVRAVLGTPLHHNMKSYEDRGVTAWFYPTADNGAAAAVWFRPDKAEQLVTYLIKYDAVAAREDAA